MSLAAVLHNTPAVCRASYVHTEVIDGFMDGSFPERYASALDAARRQRPRELRLHEGATLRFLEAQEAWSARMPGPDRASAEMAWG